jgi:hypothetical protein
MCKTEQYREAETRLKSGQKRPRPENCTLALFKIGPRSEGLTKDRAADCHSFGKNLCHEASEEGSIVKYKQTAPRGRSPAETLLEADVARLLKYRRQQKKQSSNAFGNLQLTEMRRAVLRPSCSVQSRSAQIGEHRVL